MSRDIRIGAPLLWIVVPCRDEEAMLPLSMPRLERLRADMVARGLIEGGSRIVYVDDCSTDGTWDIICRQNEENPLHCGLHLGRNAGQQYALLAGLEASIGKADCVVTVDADLQDDIGMIPVMLGHFREGYEIVCGVRTDRSTDTVFKRWTARAFYRLMDRLGAPMLHNHSEFRLMGSRAIRQLSLYREHDLFLRGIVQQLGFPCTVVTYRQGSRERGNTKYTLRKMLKLALSGITSLSVKPIHMLFVFGLLFILVALCVACWVLWCMFTGRNVAGWVSLMLSVWFVGGCILAGLGIIGEYISGIVLDVKQRPRYNVTEVKGDILTDKSGRLYEK